MLLLLSLLLLLLLSLLLGCCSVVLAFNTAQEPSYIRQGDKRRRRCNGFFKLLVGLASSNKFVLESLVLAKPLSRQAEPCNRLVLCVQFFLLLYLAQVLNFFLEDISGATRALRVARSPRVIGASPLPKPFQLRQSKTPLVK